MKRARYVTSLISLPLIFSLAASLSQFPGCGKKEEIDSCVTEFLTLDLSKIPSHQYNQIEERKDADKVIHSGEAVKLTFYGAARIVGGACILVEYRGYKILIDAGIFYLKNLIPLDQRFEFDPADLDYVILTHAHGDHNGRIPLLYKKGYQGKIYCSPATKDVSDIMLQLGASLGVPRYRIDFSNKSVHYMNCRISRTLPPDQHLDVRDAHVFFDILGYHLCSQCQKMMSGHKAGLSREIADTFKTVELGQLVELNPEVRFRLHNAGHILGSSQVELMLGSEEKAVTIVFTGDLGNQISPMDRLPEVIEKADYLVTESTYGVVRKKFRPPYYDDFINSLLSAIGRGERVIIPSFVLSKSQKIIALLAELAYVGKIPKQCPIICTSPTVQKLNDVHQKYLKNDPNTYYCPEFAKRKDWRNPFDCPQIYYGSLKTYEKQHGEIKPPVVFLVSSGMMDFAASLQMAEDYLGDPTSNFFVVGWQSPDSVGQATMKLDEVVIKGEAIKVKSRVKKFGQFSSHADLDMLMENVRRYRGLKGVLVDHGEAESALNLAHEINQEFGYPVFVPGFLDTVYLDKQSFLKVEHDFSPTAQQTRQLDPVLELPPESMKGAQRAATLNLAQAQRAYAAKKYSLAMKYARDAVTRYPNLADAHYLLGQIFRAQGMKDAAWESFQQVIRINPYDYRSYLALGEAGQQEGNLDEAIRELRSCVFYNPDDVEALARLGEIYCAGGDSAIGLELLKAANSIDPYDREISSQTERTAQRAEKRKIYYVASKKGKTFHYPWCEHARKIGEQNLIKSETRSEFLKKKYLPCSQCSP